MSEMQTLAPASSNLSEKYSSQSTAKPHYWTGLPGSESLAETLSPACDDADLVPDVHDDSLVVRSKLLSSCLTVCLMFTMYFLPASWEQRVQTNRDKNSTLHFYHFIFH